MTEDASTTQDFFYALAASASFGTGEGGVCFAARNAGLFRSDDGGFSWTPATAALGLDQSFAVTAVAVPAEFERDHTVLCGLAGGILHSGDGGKTWQLPKFNPPPPMVTAIVLAPDFSESGVALAATMQDGVMRSADGGRTWASWNFGLLDLSVLCLSLSPDFARDETVFAGTETGIFRSTNGGRAWREVELPFGFDPVLSLALSPDFGNDETLYAGTESQGLWVSRNGGEHWEQVTAPFAQEPVNGVQISSLGELVVLCSGTAWISRDGGGRWMQLWPDLAEAGEEISALLAPRGFAAGSPAWLGLYGGEVRRVNF